MPIKKSKHHAVLITVNVDVCVGDTGVGPERVQQEIARIVDEILARADGDDLSEILDGSPVDGFTFKKAQALDGTTDPSKF